MVPLKKLSSSIAIAPHYFFALLEGLSGVVNVWCRWCDLQVCSDLLLPRAGASSHAVPAAEFSDCAHHQQ